MVSIRSILSVVVCAWLLLLGVFYSCTTDYVTGKRTFSLISESQEIAMGREADPQITAEFGVYDGEITSYVESIGGRLASASQRPNLEYTFRVLDSPVVNAFALPGGYVYVTRGILAHFNSEDELAGVLGHEIGHVVARHSAEQISRVQLASLGLTLGSMISEQFQRFADVAQVGLGLLFLKFSRAQESEADMLGVQYSSLLGYDAGKMASFFETLKRMSGESGSSLPTFLSTHPDPGDRERRVRSMAREWQSRGGFKPLGKKRSDYLVRLEGMVYGEDPRQGFLESGMFYHPTLQFHFPVPSGWKLKNSPRTVQVISPEGRAAVQMTLGKEADAAAEANRFLSKTGAHVVRQGDLAVSGFNAHIVESRVKTDEGDLEVLSYFIEKGGDVFVFHGFTQVTSFDRFRRDFLRIMGGFDKEENPVILGRKPTRLHIAAAASSGTFSDVIRSIGTGGLELDELALLNGMELDERVEKGTLLKTVSAR